MIHAVTFKNMHFYPSQLDEMFMMRHQFYVEDNGWRELHSKNGRETDEFDNEQAIYFLGLDPDGRVASAMRLNPTMGPNFTARHHETYLDGPPPRAHEIWDMTRFMAAPRYRGRVKAGALLPGQEIGCAILEYALLKGISHITSISEVHILERLTKIGWSYQPLGPKIQYKEDDAAAQAIMLDVNVEMLDRMKRSYGVTDTALRIMPAQMPELTDGSLDRAGVSYMEGLIEIVGRTRSQAIMGECVAELEKTNDGSPQNIVRCVTALPRILIKRLENCLYSKPDDVSTHAS